MMRTPKALGSQMAKSYLKRHSLSSKELYKNNIQNLNSSRNNSIINKKEKDSIEMIEVRSQANSDDNYTRSLSKTFLDMNKLDTESTNNSNNNLIKPITQPLLYDYSLQVKNTNNKNDSTN